MKLGIISHSNANELGIISHGQKLGKGIYVTKVPLVAELYAGAKKFKGSGSALEPPVAMYSPKKL